MGRHFSRRFLRVKAQRVCSGTFFGVAFARTSLRYSFHGDLYIIGHLNLINDLGRVKSRAFRTNDLAGSALRDHINKRGPCSDEESVPEVGPDS